MRLRLRIERNALPPTQAVWPIKDTKSTIAQLLQSVNDVFPLEADTWGLEDYTVSVDGYECLHWYELRAACKDEDEVVIKPLQYVDVRSRTFTGRDQIAPDGRHLMDGVPFGKPQLKAPVRPEIRIPPRKKRKLNALQDQHEIEPDEKGAPLMLTENGEKMDDEDDDEDDDGDFEADDSASSSDGGEDSSSEDSSDSDSASGSESDSEDDETWEGVSTSDPATPSRKTGSSSRSASAAKNVSAKSSPDKKFKGETELDRIQRELSEMEAADAREEGRKQSRDDKKRKWEQGSTTKPNTTQASNKKSKHSTDDGQSFNAELSSAERTPTIVGKPFSGKPETKKRNDRRRDTNRLKHLIRAGALPEDATLASVRNRDDTNNENLAAGQTSSAVKSRTSDGSGEEVGRSGARKAIDVENNNEFELNRRKLISDIATGGVDVTIQPTKKRKKERKSDPLPVIQSSLRLEVDDEPPSEEETSWISASTLPARLNSPDHNRITDTVPDDTPGMPAPSTTSRSRLNLDASKRLVFGSLGVRTPKTQEEKDRLQKKLADRATRSVQLPATEEGEVSGTTQADAAPADAAPAAEAQIIFNENGDDNDDWRFKINLTAVECCDENVILSMPPFPFHQRWDPQYKKKKAKNRVDRTYMEGSGQKRKRGRQSQDYVETYDKYNINGEGDGLDYDEADEEDEDEYWEDGALLNGDSEYAEDESEEDDDRFPPLPKDINHLRILEAGDANHGDFIAFAELACDETTSWQPKEITRLAQILATSVDGSCWMQLRPQDTKQKVFDEEGNRVYSKFEMPEDADEEDDGTRTLPWKDMGTVRLVMRPEEVTKSLNLTGGRDIGQVHA